MLYTFTPDDDNNSHELGVKSGEFVWLLGDLDAGWKIVRRVLNIDQSGTLVLDRQQGIVPNSYIDLNWSCAESLPTSPVDERSIPNFYSHTASSKHHQAI